MAENKVEFGLSNVHYAPFTVVAGVPTFEEPIAIPGAVTLTMDPIGEEYKFFADNIVYYIVKSNQGYSGTLSIANIPQQFAIDALGEELDETDGVVNELALAQGKQFALLFQFEGDVKARRHVLYNCIANRPSLTGNTKQESTEITAKDLALTASPLDIDGKLLVKTRTTETTDAAVYDVWFNSVYKKVTP